MKGDVRDLSILTPVSINFIVLILYQKSIFCISGLGDSCEVDDFANTKDSNLEGIRYPHAEANLVRSTQAENKGD